MFQIPVERSPKSEMAFHIRRRAMGKKLWKSLPYFGDYILPSATNAKRDLELFGILTFLFMAFHTIVLLFYPGFYHRLQSLHGDQNTSFSSLNTSRPGLHCGHNSFVESRNRFHYLNLLSLELVTYIWYGNVWSIVHLACIALCLIFLAEKKTQPKQLAGSNSVCTSASSTKESSDTTVPVEDTGIIKVYRTKGVNAFLIAVLASLGKKCKSFIPYTQWKCEGKTYFFPRLFGFFCGATLAIHISAFFFAGLESKMLGFPDIYIIESIYQRNFISYRDSALFFFFFIIGFTLDVALLLQKMVYIIKYAHYKDLGTALVAMLLCLKMLAFFTGDIPECDGNDLHWIDFKAMESRGHVYADTVNSPVFPPACLSTYVKMRDDVELAVDVYLPQAKGRNTEQAMAMCNHEKSYATYLSFTRYGRRTFVRWPYTLLSIWGQPRGTPSVAAWSWQFINALTSNSYAVVIVDTRGTGASFGSRAVDLSEPEKGDFAEVIQWVKMQSWSNGKIATGGISYDGMTGLQAASSGGVDATVALFTPVSILNDLLVPGGLQMTSFLKEYSGLTETFESFGTPRKYLLRSVWRYPFHVTLGFLTAFGNIMPVKGRESSLRNALSSHKNWKMEDAIGSVDFSDDYVQLKDGTSVKASSTGLNSEVEEGLINHKVSVYFAAGYCDSGISRGIIELFHTLKKHNPEIYQKLVLGPWTHSGRRNCSPYSGTFPCFEKAMYADIVRFLDCRLRNICWGRILEEEPVHYWQVHEERWKSGKTFPIEDTQYKVFQLSNDALSLKLGKEPTKRPIPLHKSWTPLNLLRAFARGLNNIDITQQAQRSISSRKKDLDKTSTIEAYNKTSYKSKFTIFPQSLIHDWLPIVAFFLTRPNSLIPPLLSFIHNRFISLSYTAAWPPFDVNAYTLSTLEDDSVGHSMQAKCMIKTFSKIFWLKGTPGSNWNHDGVEAFSAAAITKPPIAYAVDYSATAGKFTRWQITQHPFRTPVMYGNRLFIERVAGREHAGGHQWSFFNIFQASIASPLSFATQSLNEAISIAGSPLLTLYIFVDDCTDATIFVYLEDVDKQQGVSHYVTEGQILASRRRDTGSVKFSDLSPLDSMGFNSYSLKREDFAPISGGEMLKLEIVLEPVAWTFASGHAIRLSFLGSDIGNFSLHSPDKVTLPEFWHVFTAGNAHPAHISNLKLPISPIAS